MTEVKQEIAKWLKLHDELEGIVYENYNNMLIVHLIIKKVFEYKLIELIRELTKILKILYFDTSNTINISTAVYGSTIY